MSAARWKLLAALPVFYLLFFYGLSRTGLVGPDEPRYASIGREMAQSGDWVTPRLWGQPWFEKPPLIYWLAAAGHHLGLGEDLAPRLPVALLSAAFLCAYYAILKRQWGERTAAFAAVILGSSAGWLAFSNIAVPDLPMSAAFSVAMLLALRWRANGVKWMPAAAGAQLGVAVLGKGLVPLVLALPLVWVIRKRWTEWFSPWPILSFLAVAAPWYVLCALRHGSAFWDEFFWKHHFARFATGESLHPQPFWFYVPVLVAAVFPWSPLLALLFRPGLYRDADRRFLLLWLGFGFVFFSASSGKLPGYLLPLLPALAALMGLALSEARRPGWVLAASAALLTLIPAAGAVLPQALAVGLSRSRISGWDVRLVAICGGMALLVWMLERAGRRGAAVAAVLAGTVCGVVWVKRVTLPEIDRLVSARALWREVEPAAARTCIGQVPRTLQYGLNYYSRTPLPDCSVQMRPLRITQQPGRPPEVIPANPTP